MKKIFIVMLAIISINLKAQLHIESNATIENTGNVFVSGDVLLSTNSLLVNNGRLEIIKDFFWSANFFDNSTLPYNYGVGRTVFVGNGDQFVSTVNNFGTIEVNNTGLNLLKNTNSNNWFLKIGKVNTNSFYAIANSTIQNAIQNDPANTDYTKSWFNGNLRRYVTANAVDNYLFPVGNPLHPNIAELDNLSIDPINVNYVDVSFKAKLGNDAGLNVSENGTPYTAVNDGGVWDITPDVLPVTGKYDLKLYFNEFIGLQDNKFGILERPISSSNAIDWKVPALSVLPPSNAQGRIVSSGYAKRNNMSTFGQYGIGMSLLPLPLKLLSFTGIKKDKEVLLQWITTNEINVSHFEVYRNNQYLDNVPAAGLITNTYNHTDYSPVNGLNLYKLKIIDKDNSYNWSNTIAINFEQESKISVYPNPVTGNHFYINGVKAKEVRLIASDGKEVLHVYNSNKVLLPTNLTKGNYIVQISTNKELISTIILKQK